MYFIEYIYSTTLTLLLDVISALLKENVWRDFIDKTFVGYLNLFGLKICMQKLIYDLELKTMTEMSREEIFKRAKQHFPEAFLGKNRRSSSWSTIKIGRISVTSYISPQNKYEVSAETEDTNELLQLAADLKNVYLKIFGS